MNSTPNNNFTIQDIVDCILSINNINLKIQDILKLILVIGNIKSKDDLDEWCGGRNRTKLYTLIQIFASSHWDSLVDPKAYVRYYYQIHLIGFQIYAPN